MFQVELPLLWLMVNVGVISANVRYIVHWLKVLQLPQERLPPKYYEILLNLHYENMTWDDFSLQVRFWFIIGW